MRKTHILGTLLLGLALVLSACGSKPVPSPSPSPSPTPQPAPAPAPQLSAWDRVVADAKKEGTITVYSAASIDVAKAIREGVAKAYGIKVEIVTDAGPAIVERTRVEQQARSAAADMVVMAGVVTYSQLVAQDFVIAPTVDLPAASEKGVWRVEPYSFNPQKKVTVINNALIPSVLINTDLVRPSEVTALADLLAPRWKGNIAMEDPRVGGAGNATLATFISLGEDFWKKIAAQNVQLMPSALGINAIVHGDKHLEIGASSTRGLAAIKAGAPMQYIHVKEGTPSVTKGAVLTKNAPHPNAALVVLNWLLSKEGQTAVNMATGDPSIRSDVGEDWVYPSLRSQAAQKLLPPVDNDPDYQKKGSDFGVKIFGR